MSLTVFHSLWQTFEVQSFEYFTMIGIQRIAYRNSNLPPTHHLSGMADRMVKIIRFYLKYEDQFIGFDLALQSNSISNTDVFQSVLLVLQDVANEGDAAFVEVATKWCIAFGVGSFTQSSGRTALADRGGRKLRRMCA